MRERAHCPLTWLHVGHRVHIGWTSVVAVVKLANIQHWTASGDEGSKGTEASQAKLARNTDTGAARRVLCRNLNLVLSFAARCHKP